MRNVLFVFIFLQFSWILNAQNSLRTTLISSWSDPTNTTVEYNDVWGWSNGAGDELAIIGSETHINFVDISNPAVPSLVFQFLGGSNTGWRDIKTYGNYAYSVCDVSPCNEGLHIFDLSNAPASISHVNTITTDFLKAHNIFIDEPNHRLYAVGLSSTVDMLVYDLQGDPTNPVLLQSLTFDNAQGNMYIHDVFVKDNIAYASHEFEGFFIWDLNDLNNVVLLADNAFGGYNHSNWLTDDGKYSYVAEEVPRGLPIVVVRVDNLSNGIQKDASFHDSLEDLAPGQEKATYHNPFVKDDLLYISSYMDGVKIYDITSPLNPKLWAYYDTYPANNGSYGSYNGAWGTYPYLPSDLVLVSDIVNGLFVIELDKCNGISHTLFNETSSQVESYSDKIISMPNNSSISGNVDSYYTARNGITLNEGFRIDLGSNVILTTEYCLN